MANSFVSFTNNKFKIEPSYEMHGIFEVFIILKDDNIVSKNQTYSFEIIVEYNMPEEEEEEDIEENEDEKEEEEESNSKYEIIPTDDEEEYEEDSSINAEITDISRVGLVSVEFNHKMIVPSNY